MVSVNEKLTCCECENTTHLSGFQDCFVKADIVLLSALETTCMIQCLFVPPRFLQRTLEFHLALITTTVNKYTTIFTYL